MLPLIMAGMMAAQSLQKGKEARGQAKIDKFQMKSAIKVENRQREADNILRKTKGDLARYQQANANKYKLIQGAEQVESRRTNLLRLSDQATRGGFEARIAASEEAGALAAATGGAGIGGGSIDMLNATMKLRTQRVQELNDRQFDTMTADGERAIEQTQRATILGLDDIQFNDDINYHQAQEQYIKQPSWAEIGMQAGMQFASTYHSMDGFKGWGNKLPEWAGGKPKAVPFGTQAGNFITTQIK